MRGLWLKSRGGWCVRLWFTSGVVWSYANKGRMCSVIVYIVFNGSTSVSILCIRGLCFRLTRPCFRTKYLPGATSCSNCSFNVVLRMVKKNRFLIQRYTPGVGSFGYCCTTSFLTVRELDFAVLALLHYSCLFDLVSHRLNFIESKACSLRVILWGLILWGIQSRHRTQRTQKLARRNTALSTWQVPSPVTAIAFLFGILRKHGQPDCKLTRVRESQTRSCDDAARANSYGKRTRRDVSIWEWAPKLIHTYPTLSRFIQTLPYYLVSLNKYFG